MKKIYTIAWAAVALLALSCSKDLGNYDFKPKEVISIEGVEKSYSISGTERLMIDPSLSSSEGNANFDCFWGIYDGDYQGLDLPKMDTISKTKTLDYLVTQRPYDKWKLVFCAKNKQTGFAQYWQIPLRVTTPSAGGWYVLKDDGSQSDIDLFKTPTSIMPASKLENIYSSYNGKKMEGKALFLAYSTEYQPSSKTLFVGTDKDLSALSIYTFKEFRNLGGLFFEKPSVKAPGFLMNTGANYFLLNDGQLHGLSTILLGGGLFSTRKLIDNVNSPYKLSKYFTVDEVYRAPYFFDDMSSSFFMAGDATDAALTAVTDAKDKNGKLLTAMTAKNNNKKLLFMDGLYAYFQDKTDANLKILSNLTLNSSAFQMVNDTVKTMDKFFNATNIAILQAGDENMVYFANGNEVWSRNLSNKQETRQFIVPAGEEITFIKHRKSEDEPYAYNYVMVGTKVGGNYKVRMFEKSSGDLKPTPKFILEGTGSVGDVYFVK
ncbi:PKD-like family lipoprotein [Solitalea sp. MAHUQ-68]|uniref:PKD-like family lipoprotein n=1 Tax=Solitalea agri TaxID=2953739 RepID=A0A9X2JDV5_9SPHI|nr:PKD-like family lipoprotein [Solitalea agri]MCO4294054.1 PKD-like family lipoprotein [Solitalea agri]